jgi:hypothetical protein
MAKTRRQAMRRQELIVKKIGLLILLCFVSGSGLMAEEMSADEWLRFNDEVTAMFEDLSEKIPNGEALPIKCATPLLNALISSQPKGVDAKMLYVGREDTMSYTYGTAHFLIHYTDTGPNRVYQFDVQDSLPGVPDYIFEGGKILDSIWEHTVGDLQFTQPVSDGYYNGGGDGRLDVYIIDFQAYGATVRDSILATLPITVTTYMFIENDYEGFPGYEFNRLNAFRVAAAHEFFHSVQFAIDAGEIEGDFPDWNPAWIEMSATFMEEEHYDEINDYYNYLLFFYDVPQWSLRTGTIQGSQPIDYWRNLHMYGSVVFPIFLSERYGSGIVKSIWDGCGTVAGPNWWLAADDAIKSHSGDTRDLEDEFQEFALWNLFTRNRAKPADYFLEGDAYDSVNLAARITSYPTTITPIDSALPDNLGANYIIMENVSSMPSGLAVAFSPDPAQTWGITVVGMHNNISLPVYVEHIRFDTLSSLIQIPNAADYDRLALIVTVLAGNAVQADYTLTVTPLAEGVAQPNGGEVLFAGFEYEIRWYFEDAGASVQIDFSSDNGQTWSSVSATDNDLVYEWTIPNVTSDSCLIRVTDLGPQGTSDVSDSVFSIMTTAQEVDEPFPNPAWIQKHDAVNFKATYQAGAGEDPTMNVTIMTLAGEKVKEIEGESSSGLALTQWDFTNTDNKTVAAGPYLAVIKFNGETVIKKFVVLR